MLLQDYIRYGLELAEYHLLESYDGVKDKTDETDRVFLESVQVSFKLFLLNSFGILRLISFNIFLFSCLFVFRGFLFSIWCNLSN